MHVHVHGICMSKGLYKLFAIVLIVTMSSSMGMGTVSPFYLRNPRRQPPGEVHPVGSCPGSARGARVEVKAAFILALRFLFGVVQRGAEENEA